MKRFIKKTLLLPIGLIVSYALIYYGFNTFLNNSFNSKNAIFIWGDSQAYYGIDLKELSSSIGKRVFTSAHSGAGVYDFLVFTEQVPNNAEVVVSISKLGQIRRKDNDFNRSGLSFWALKNMYKNNYSMSDILSIAKLNLKPKSNISESTKLYNYSEEMKIDLPLSHFYEYYKEIPDFLIDKQNLYVTGVKNLIRKNCKISFLEFPYHSQLEKIENQSEIKKKTDNFKHKISGLFKDFKMDTIEINNNRNMFKDLSHLNNVGAQDLSEKLGEVMLKSKGTTMYIAH